MLKMMTARQVKENKKTTQATHKIKKIKVK